MGVDLGDIAVKNKISLDSLSSRIIAVDAFNVLYQFLASIRQEDGTPLMDFKGNITAHLSGLFYRNVKILENGIRPIYVFDGVAPEFKGKVQSERSAAKKEAYAKWQKALEEERLEDAKKYAQATSRLTNEMVVESKLLLDAMGIPWVQAPGEGEAQAAQMVKKGQAYAVASQDYDALLFGSPVLVRNISITGKRKVPRQDRYVMIEPEEIKLEETLSSLNLNQEQLIAIGILIGTDYNEGVKGIGPKTALKIVNEHVRFKKIMDFVKEKYKYEFDVEPEDVLDCFMHPKCDEVKASSALKKPNPDKIRSILVEQHDFSEERVMRTLDTLQEALKEKGSQRNLGQWF